MQVQDDQIWMLDGQLRALTERVEASERRANREFLEDEKRRQNAADRADDNDRATRRLDGAREFLAGELRGVRTALAEDGKILGLVLAGLAFVSLVEAAAILVL